uniref:Lipoprotein n=1 Tax=Candidatus Kentrum sp. TUN TaxID=2126343 RepID=A0A451A627_9GAMM|nr:MAG: hypothetical protein BECKTUN1418D_GA0071000_11533 [Candidatus Kentron sp. TUN]
MTSPIRYTVIFVLLNMALLSACDSTTTRIKTHPDPEDRIKAMEQIIKDLKTQQEAEKINDKDKPYQFD